MPSHARTRSYPCPPEQEQTVFGCRRRFARSFWSVGRPAQSASRRSSPTPALHTLRRCFPCYLYHSLLALPDHRQLHASLPVSWPQHNDPHAPPEPSLPSITKLTLSICTDLGSMRTKASFMSSGPAFREPNFVSSKVTRLQGSFLPTR